MRWDNLLFLHWEWDPGDLRMRLPPGLLLDTFDGRSYLGVVPFRMRRVRPAFFPPSPWLSNFEELNVRTYVIGPDGSPGVWFFSLACNQPLAVEVAKAFFHLNYRHAVMRSRIEEGMCHLTSRRQGSRAGRFVYPADCPDARPARVGSIEEFLLERYALYSADAKGQLYRGDVYHDRYQIRSIPTPIHSFQTAVDDGFSPPGRAPAHCHCALPVDVRADPVRRIRIPDRAGY